MPSRALAVIAVWGVMGAVGCQSMSVTKGPVLDGNSYLFANGKGVQGFAYPAEAVRDAVIEAMRDLRMSDLRAGNTAGIATISAITADRRICNVDIVTQNAVSLVTAKVGAFGDRNITQALFGGIGSRLGSQAPGTAPPADVEPARDEVGSRDGDFDEEVSRTSGRLESSDLFSRDAVSDDVMLKNQAEIGYKENPIE